MEKPQKRGLYNFFVLFVLGALPIVLHLLGMSFLTIFATAIIAIMICHCLQDLSSNVFLLCFLLSFFVFLMSGDIVAELFGEYYHLRFSQETTRHCWVAIVISLIFLYIGYMSKRKVSQFKLKTIFSNFDVSKIRNASKWIYYVTFCVLLFNTLDKIQFVSRYGYIAYYLSYDPILPTVIAELGDFAPISLCVFLATFPSKKEAMRPIVLYFIYACLLILVGARGGLIYNAVFLIGYMLYRNRHNSNSEVWISRKTLILLCASVPVVLVLLFLYGYVRVGADIVYDSFGDTLIDFFVNIGSSSTVIKYGYESRDLIETFKFYSLGDTLNYFKYGTLFNLFDLDSIPHRHSVQFALESHSFDTFLSYHYMRDRYLNGEGMGSSFIAILFADFGYIGVAIGSFLYGRLFKSMSYINNDGSWLCSTIKLYFFMLLIKAPRGAYDGFLSGIININFWLLIFGIMFVSQYVKGRKNGLE